jgi:hypothetical protein
MHERPTAREILNRTNEVFLQNFGRIVAPALLAGLLDYWTSVGYSRIGHRIDYALFHHFRGDTIVAVRAVILPGILLRLSMYAANTLFWGVAFAVIAQIVAASTTHESNQVPSGVRRLLQEPGWISLLWRLYLRLAIPGYLALMASTGSAAWLTQLFHLNLALPRAQFQLELLVLILFGAVYMWYARRYTLSIPLPIVVRDAPIDPLSASAAASRRWRAPIIMSTFAVLFISNLCDYHLPRLFLASTSARPDLLGTYLIWMSVSLATSVLWAWLFTFLTEIALIAGPAVTAISDGASGPLEIPYS